MDLRYPFLLIAALTAYPLQARPVQQLADFTRNEVELLDKAVNEHPSQTLELEQAGGWHFKRFVLRVQAKVGFTIEAANVDLVPEIELVWQRETSDSL